MLKTIHRMQRNERGFTLVELLIVIAIIAILAAIAIPQFSKYRQDANKRAAVGNARTCLTIAAGKLANNPGDTVSTADCPAGCTSVDENGNSATCTVSGQTSTCTVTANGTTTCT